jgi:F0F1-type ATP synthase gamma subunit
MRQLQLVRKELAFQKDFIRLIETMRNTAHRSYIKTKEIEGEYYEGLISEIKNFAAFLYRANVKSSFVSTNVEKECFVLVTPDSGMMGGLNNHVTDEYKSLVSKCNVEPLTFVLGEKGAIELGGRANVLSFTGYKEDAKDISDKVKQIRAQIFEEVLKGNIGRVGVVYPSSISFQQQTVKYDILLPCRELLGDVSLDIKDSREPILDSPPDSMATYLASQWLDVRFRMVLKDAKLAEFSARAVHLNTSYENLEKQLDDLEKEYLKIRRTNIDKQIAEANASQLLRKRKYKRFQMMERAKLLNKRPQSKAN